MGLFSSRPVTYEFCRLASKADGIEPLRDRDSLRVGTLVGTFQMTKAEFYRDFANVVRSRSYRRRGLYHSPTVPENSAP